MTSHHQPNVEINLNRTRTCCQRSHCFLHKLTVSCSRQFLPSRYRPHRWVSVAVSDACARTPLPLPVKHMAHNNDARANRPCSLKATVNKAKSSLRGIGVLNLPLRFRLLPPAPRPPNLSDPSCRNAPAKWPQNQPSRRTLQRNRMKSPGESGRL